MTMRDLALKAMAMRNHGKTSDEIRKFVWGGVNAIATDMGTPMTETNDGEYWQMTLASESVVFGRDGYSYSPNA